MGKQLYQPIYDITKSFEDNLKAGPNPAFKTKLSPPKLKQKFTLLGYKVNSPFGSAACPTGTDSRFIKQMFNNGYDIVTTKTRRSVYYQPNEFPNLVHIVPGRIAKGQEFEELPDRVAADSSEYETLTVANSYGNNSVDPKYWVPDARKANDYAAATGGRLLITSIVGTIQSGFTTDDYYQDFVKTALLAKDSGAHAIEINFSCPNVANEGVLCYDPDAVVEVSKRVKKAVGDIPLIAKVGYFPKSEQKLLETMVVSVAPYVAAINAINTFAAPIYHPEGGQAMPGKGRLKAGVSGHAIKDIGLDMAERLANIRNSRELPIEIMSCGGVLTPQDFQDYRDAGADAVLSATGAIWNPDLANQIKQHLAAHAD